MCGLHSVPLPRISQQNVLASRALPWVVCCCCWGCDTCQCFGQQRTDEKVRHNYLRNWCDSVNNVTETHLITNLTLLTSAHSKHRLYYCDYTISKLGCSVSINFGNYKCRFLTIFKLYLTQSRGERIKRGEKEKKKPGEIFIQERKPDLYGNVFLIISFNILPTHN